MPVNSDAIVPSILQFDGLVFAITNEITPVGSASRHLVHILEIFLLVAGVTNDIAILPWEPGRRKLVRIENQCARFNRQIADVVHDHVERHVAFEASSLGKQNRSRHQPVALQTLATGGGCDSRRGTWRPVNLSSSTR